MCLFQIVCVGLLATIAHTQLLQNCGVDTSAMIIGSTADADTLATSTLGCSNGDLAVQWVGEVFIEETIHVTGGTSLNITGSGPGAIANGGGITQMFYVDESSRLHLSDMTLAHGNSTSNGGAIFVEQSSLSFSGNMSFISSFASEDGGAIYASESNVSWDGDGTRFISNSAGGTAGAIYALQSNLSWDGDGTQFVANSAVSGGGAIRARESNLFWVGDDTQFISNTGGFVGGAIYAFSANVSWEGDRTEFMSNTAGFGGAIYGELFEVSWHGGGTEFITNFADQDGGVMYAYDSYVFLGGPTTFTSNAAGDEGGALSLKEFSQLQQPFVGATFINNSAGHGGAIYLFNFESGLNFTDVTFHSNTATAGGAVVAYGIGSEFRPLTFSRCNFSRNMASGIGGAVDTLIGGQEFYSCHFEGNSAGEGVLWFRPARGCKRILHYFARYV